MFNDVRSVEAEDGFVHTELIMAGPKACQHWDKRIPRDIPSTHELFSEWFEETKGPRTVVGIRIGVRRKGGAKPVPAADVSAAREKLMGELSKLPRAELLTRAAEAGVPGVEKNMTNARIVSAIIDHLTAAKAG